MANYARLDDLLSASKELTKTLNDHNLKSEIEKMVELKTEAENTRKELSEITQTAQNATNIYTDATSDLIQKIESGDMQNKQKITQLETVINQLDKVVEDNFNTITNTIDVAVENVTNEQDENMQTVLNRIQRVNRDTTKNKDQLNDMLSDIQLTSNQLNHLTLTLTNEVYDIQGQITYNKNKNKKLTNMYNEDKERQDNINKELRLSIGDTRDDIEMKQNLTNTKVQELSNKNDENFNYVAAMEVDLTALNASLSSRFEQISIYCIYFYSIILILNIAPGKIY